MAGIYPLSRMQQFDKDTGKALSGGKLYLFQTGTDSPLTAYKDFGLTTVHPNPIVCDSAGRLPMIFMADGTYKHRLTNPAGTVQFQDDSVPVTGPSSGGGGGGSTVDPNALLITRDLKIRFDDQPLDGYVRLNGRTIGSAVSGATERANADTQSLFTELWTFANISVPGGKGATAAADWAANKLLTLPDFSGRLIGGLDNMGNGAQSRITQANLGVDPTVVGAVGGEEKHTLATTEIPSHTHQVTGNTQAGTPHNHGVHSDGNNNNGNINQRGGDGTGVFPSNTGDESAHTHPIDITSAPQGGGLAHNNLPPVALIMIYIRL